MSDPSPKPLRLRARWSISLNFLSVVLFVAGGFIAPDHRHQEGWREIVAFAFAFTLCPLCALGGTILAFLALFKERGCLSWVAFASSVFGVGFIAALIWIGLEAVQGFR